MQVKRVIPILILMFICLTVSANAIIYESIDSPTGIYEYDDDSMIYGDSTGNISIFYPDSGSTSKKIIECPAGVTDVVTNDVGNIFFTTNGNLYKTTDTAGLINFSNSQDYEDYILKLGTNGGQLTIDTEGNIYVGSGTTLYKYTAPTYSVSQIESFSHNIGSVGIHPNGILVATSYSDHDSHDSWAYNYLYSVNDSGKTEIYNGGTQNYICAGDNDYNGGLASTVSNKVFYSYDLDAGDYHKTGWFKYNGSDGYSESKKGSTVYDSFYIDKDGIIYATNTGGNYIQTLSTDSGGYPSGGTIGATYTAEWNQSEYTVSPDTNADAEISTTIEPFDDSANDYRLDIRDTNSDIIAQIPISSSSQTSQITFSSYDKAGGYLAELVKIDSGGNKTILTEASTQLTKQDMEYSISFDSTSYNKGDTATVYYEALPTNTTVYINGLDEDTNTDTYTNTITKSGSGSIDINIPQDTEATSYSVRAILDGEILDDDFVDIIQDSTTKVDLYGKVIDSETGATVEDVAISVSGRTVYTDETGRYNIIVSKSTDHTITVSKDGYNSKTLDNVTITSNKNMDFYLTEDKGGTEGLIYGTITDYTNGEGMGEVAVYCLANDTTKTTYTNGKGYYEFYVDAGNYTVKATKTGYDTYIKKNINVSGNTWHEFAMTPIDYGGGDVEDDGLTGHEMAEESFKNAGKIIPSIFTLVILMLLLTILKRGGK